MNFSNNKALNHKGLSYAAHYLTPINIISYLKTNPSPLAAFSLNKISVQQPFNKGGRYEVFGTFTLGDALPF